MKHLIVSACLLAAACVGHQEPATQAEKDGATQAYGACLLHASEALDDGKSDAASVAVGVRGMCDQEFRRSVVLYDREMNPEMRRLYEARAEQDRLSFATAAVLRVRAQRAATK